MSGDTKRISKAIELEIQEQAERNGLDPAVVILNKGDEMTFSEMLRRCASVGADPCAVYRAAWRSVSDEKR